MDWLLLGTGPSAARWPIKPACKVATVNGGHALVDEPDAYGVFEINAGKAYRQQVKATVRAGVPMFMRKAAAVHAGRLADPRGVTMVGRDWGPPDLHYLHRDVQWKQEDPGSPEYGQSTAWITSGVLMLWILAETYSPGAIFIAGIDGYPEDRTDGDYAEGVVKVGDLDNEPTWKRRRRELNKRAEEGLAAITKYYTNTEFVFLEEPRHDISKMRARVAMADDLKRLYEGR